MGDQVIDETYEHVCGDPTRTEVLQQTLREEEIEGMTQIFKALSDPNRMKIAYLLQDQELCVYDISVILGTSVATASHHLRQLKQMNITKSRKDGKHVFYSLKDHHIQTLITMTLEHHKERNDHE
ncbi:metalloregulator ArsR/SmtB family transcription factor [Paenibacillus sp. D2_2]|uniref:ArsR/SmtB family transcription factor n=1 Tax=Paenibacillus sp. D2_2 TaxID=3073092 RepID=UPI002815111F|nr:metalloregulator ArsR/SmtB family transcription factor [Paenibacillus sp. D2_2]WMT41108.1 metalloregulator ArsR/SmtB family transcription factor [Paenibacillus sp. D2_2]